MKLTPALSAYLDFLRFIAALAVLLGHMVQDGFNMSWMPLAQLKHEAVIVFFVMSGYIIYASTATRRGTTRDYVVARVSRIYSVVLPAVVFSVALAVVSATVWPAETRAIASWRPLDAGDIAASLLFLNESWGLPTDLTLNGPYWSLCYEVWYYALFCAFFFVQGRWRWMSIGGLALIAGPGIVLLFPIWILGAWLAARPRPVFQTRPNLALLIWVGAAGFIWLLNLSGIEHVLKDYLHHNVPGFWRLEASQRLVTDYLIAVTLAMHLVAFQQLPLLIQQVFLATRHWWGTLAGFSFTLYLFHRPMTSLAGALIPAEQQTVSVAIAAAMAVLLACWLIALLTERKMHLWRAGVRNVLNRLWPMPELARP